MSFITEDDDEAVNKIVDQLKKNGLFDDIRKLCLSDVDQKMAYTSLCQRVEGSVNGFLLGHQWRPEVNKNQLRDGVRKHAFESPLLVRGVNHIIDQVIRPHISATIEPNINNEIRKYIQDEEGLPAAHNGEVCEDTQEALPTLLDVNGQPIDPSSSPFFNTLLDSNNQPFHQYQSLSQPPTLVPQLPLEGDTQEVVQTETVTTTTEKKKSKPEPLTVEDLLNIPLPKELPPPGPSGEKEDQKKAGGEDEDQEQVVDGGGEREDGAEEVVETEYVIVDSGVCEVMQEGEDGQVMYLMKEGLVDVTHGEEEVEPEQKMYQFAWQNMTTAEDTPFECNVSSVHTSDLSSFEDEEEEEAENEGEEDEVLDLEELVQAKKQAEEKLEEQEVVTGALEGSLSAAQAKPHKLIALQYNMSDSEDEDRKEERRQKVARERAERQVLRQQRRAELNERQQRLAAERQKMKMDRKKEQGEVAAAMGKEEVTPKVTPPKKQRRTKAVLKQEIREQKVLEKQMALRRQRRLNPKYLSDDFESVFTANRQLLAPSIMGYQQVEEQEVVLENTGFPQDMVELGEEAMDVEYFDTEDRQPQGDIYVVSEDVVQDETMQDKPTETSQPNQEQPQEERRGSTSSRASTPYSEISGSSLSSAALGQQECIEEDISSNESLMNDSTSDKEENNSENRQDSQRYNDSDLYKPRLSLRRQPRGTSGRGDAGDSPTSTRKERLRGHSSSSSSSPPRSPSRSPARLLAKSPARPLARSPARALARSPVRALARSPARPLARSPVKSSNKLNTLSKIRMSTKSPSRSQSGDRSPAKSPVRPQSYGRSSSRSSSTSHDHVRSVGGSPAGVKSRSRSRSHSGSRHSSRSRSHRDSSSRSRSRSQRHSSISSSSSLSGKESETESEKNRRRKRRGRVPINMVSFGQAEKFSKDPTYPVNPQGHGSTTASTRTNFRPFNRDQGFQRGFTHNSSTPRNTSDSYYNTEGRDSRHRGNDRYNASSSPSNTGASQPPSHRRLGNHLTTPSIGAFRGRNMEGGYPESPVRTRSSRRSQEEDNAPIAKRLRRP